MVLSFWWKEVNVAYTCTASSRIDLSLENSGGYLIQFKLK